MAGSTYGTASLALTAAAATGVQVGAAMVATRFVVGEVGPASLALLRYAIGVLCLLPFILLRRPHVRMPPRDLVPIALLWVAQFGLLIALLNWGLARVPAARGALVFACFPLLTMLVAASLGRERLTPGKTLGVALTVAGVGVALGEGGTASGPGHDLVGEGAVLAAALCGAVCSVLYRPYLQRHPALPVGAVAMLASVAALAVAAGVAEGFFQAPPHLTPGGWLAVVFIGASSGVGYVLWLWALGHASPTRVTVFLALSPVTALVLGAMLLGEPAGVNLVAGVLLLGAGLWVATRGGEEGSNRVGTR